MSKAVSASGGEEFPVDLNAEERASVEHIAECDHLDMQVVAKAILYADDN